LPSGWPSGFELALAVVLAAACGGAGSVGGVSPQSIPFTDHGLTQQAGHGGGPRIAVGTTPAETGLGQVAPAAQAGRLYVGVYAGQQRTGGYGVRVDRIERDGDRLVVRATFIAPAPDALTIQVLTSPAQLVSIERQGVVGVRDAVLVDHTGTERARTTVPQSPT
jgi:hypothetical protein